MEDKCFTIARSKMDLFLHQKLVKTLLEPQACTSLVLLMTAPVITLKSSKTSTKNKPNNF